MIIKIINFSIILSAVTFSFSCLADDVDFLCLENEESFIISQGQTEISVDEISSEVEGVSSVESSIEDFSTNESSIIFSSINSSVGSVSFDDTSGEESFVSDRDQDKIPDEQDNCPDDYNSNQMDNDLDGFGNACDFCPNDPLNDFDSDEICGKVDNCPNVFNPTQLDSDRDLLGDVCDFCPLDFENDKDGDSVCGDVDNCPAVSNHDQTDSDDDKIGDACDSVVVKTRDVFLNDPNFPKNAIFYLVPWMNESVVQKIKNFDLAIIDLVNMESDRNPEMVKKIGELNPDLALLFYVNPVQGMWKRDDIGHYKVEINNYCEANNGWMWGKQFNPTTGQYEWTNDLLIFNSPTPEDEVRLLNPSKFGVGDYLADKFPTVFDNLISNWVTDLLISSPKPYGVLFDNANSIIMWIAYMDKSFIDVNCLDVNNNKNCEDDMNELDGVWWRQGDVWWSQGYQNIISNVKEKLYSWGDSSDFTILAGNHPNNFYDDLEVVMLEDFPSPALDSGNFFANMNFCLTTNKKLIINGCGAGNDWQKFRFGFVSALYCEAFFSYDNPEVTHDTIWWDQFAEYYRLKLGKIIKKEILSTGVYRVDLDNGIGFLNPPDNPEIKISLEKKYQKIKGEFDPLNNGETVSSITLKTGDAIVLLK